METNGFSARAWRALGRALKYVLIALLILVVLLVAVVVGVDRYVAIKGRKAIGTLDDLRRPVDAIIVPGAQVLENYYPSVMLRDRLDGAIELYRAGIAPRILVTGDHREDNYNEVGVMRRYLTEHGVPDEAIFMDHFGLDTYDSVVRAHLVFQIETAVIATQRFHLERALYIARSHGYDFQGYTTDYHAYGVNNYVREAGARLKAVYEVTVGASPTRLDPVRPITGDARDTREPWGEPWRTPVP